MQRFRVDLKTFLGLAIPKECYIPCCQKVNILADFLVGFLGKKPQTLLIPIYSTTLLYDIWSRKVLLAISMSCWLSTTCHHLWCTFYASLVAVISAISMWCYYYYWPSASVLTTCDFNYRHVSSTMMYFISVMITGCIIISHQHRVNIITNSYQHMSSTIKMCHWLSTCVINYQHESTIDMSHQLLTWIIDYDICKQLSTWVITYQHKFSTIDLTHRLSTRVISYQHVPSTINMSHWLICVNNYQHESTIEMESSNINMSHQLLTWVIDYWHKSSTIDMSHWLSTWVISYQRMPLTIDMSHWLWHV